MASIYFFFLAFAMLSRYTIKYGVLVVRTACLQTLHIWFSFLSSRGLLKNSDESSGSSEAGMADPILSKSEALSEDQSLQDGETVAETQTQS